MFIGVDVGSQALEVAASTTAELPRRVPNSDDGIATLVTALTALTPARIVLEATGNYHRPLLAALLVANPAQIAAFRQSRLGRQRISPWQLDPEHSVYRRGGYGSAM